MCNYDIEDWWKHNGCFDREQASRIPYDGDVISYLQVTDDWWDSLSDSEKEAVYTDYFSEY